MARSYGTVLADNVKAWRNRKGLNQKSLAARMQALGFSAWFTQTVGKTERGVRRLAAEEIIALAFALEISVPVLLAPTQDDETVELPGGVLVERRVEYKNSSAA